MPNLNLIILLGMLLTSLPVAVFAEEMTTTQGKSLYREATKILANSSTDEISRKIRVLYKKARKEENPFKAEKMYLLTITLADGIKDLDESIDQRDKLQDVFKKQIKEINKYANNTTKEIIFGKQIELIKKRIELAKEQVQIAKKDGSNILFTYKLTVSVLYNNLSSLYLEKIPRDIINAEKTLQLSIKWNKKNDYSRGFLDSNLWLARMYEIDGGYDKARKIYQDMLIYSRSSLDKRINERIQGGVTKANREAYKPIIDFKKGREQTIASFLVNVENKLGIKPSLEISLINNGEFSSFSEFIRKAEQFSLKKDFEGGVDFASTALSWAEKKYGANYSEMGGSYGLHTIYQAIAGFNKELYFKTNNRTYLDKAEKNYIQFNKLQAELSSWFKAGNMPHIAYVYLLQNRLDLANSAYLEAFPGATQAQKEELLRTNNLRFDGLAKIAYTKGNYNDAKELLLKWIENHNDLNYTFEGTTTLGAKYILSKVYQKMGEHEQSTKLITEILKQDNKYQNQAIWGMGTSARQKFIELTQIDKNNLMLNYFSEIQSPSSNIAALYYSLTRKGALLQLASAINEVSKTSSDPDIQRLKNSMQSKQKKVVSLSAGTGSDISVINVLKAEIEALEAELSRKIQFKKSYTEVSAEEVITTLGAKNALVDFHVYRNFDQSNVKALAFWDKGVPEVDYQEEHLTALVASENKVEWVDFGELAPITRMIHELRFRMLERKSNWALKRSRVLQQELYQLLWKPLKKHLINKEKIYLIPDGILHLLPFKSMQDQNNRYLAENHNLITLSSAKDVVLKSLAGKSTGSSIFAYPLYEPDQKNQQTGDENPKNRNQGIIRVTAQNILNPLAALKPLGQLKGTLEEGRVIKTLMDEEKYPAELFTLKDATEEKIMSLQGPKILHLATHGFFMEPPNKEAVYSKQNISAQNSTLSNALLRTGLYFYNANVSIKNKKVGNENDGILTALEVLKLNLLGTDLVTLSACETGVGEVNTGEGVYSLGRAFQEAGAKSVLSSLWSINDKGSAVFMKTFYEYFLKSGSAQKALQKTQLKFIQDKDWKDPYYWSAFVVTGRE